MFLPQAVSHQPGHWQVPVLLGSVPACFKAPQHPPSAWRASESLECFPSLPGPLLPPGAFRSRRAVSTLRYTKTLQFPEESWDLGSLPPSTPPSLPGAQLWGNSPLPCSRAKASPSPQCPRGSSAGVRKFSLAVWAPGSRPLDQETLASQLPISVLQSASLVLEKRLKVVLICPRGNSRA